MLRVDQLVQLIHILQRQKHIEFHALLPCRLAQKRKRLGGLRAPRRQESAE
jgi:hypothetical protein